MSIISSGFVKIEDESLRLLLDQLSGGCGDCSGYGVTTRVKQESAPEAPTIKKSAAQIEEDVPAVRVDPVNNVTAHTNAQTTSVADSVLVNPMPRVVPKNVIYSHPPLAAPGPVQTYTHTVALKPRSVAPSAPASVYADQLLKAAHANIRRGGSVVGNAAYVVGPDVLSATAASIHPFMVQACMAKLNLTSGFVAQRTYTQLDVAVVTVSQSEAFMVSDPHYRPIYMPETIPGNALGAFLALTRAGGVSAYGWDNPAKAGVVPLNTLRRYPTGFAGFVAVVVQDGSRHTRLLPAIDHTALTMDAVDQLIRWYEVARGARPLAPLVWKTAAALSYGYGALALDAEDSAGDGLRYGTPNTMHGAVDLQAQYRAPTLAEYAAAADMDDARQPRHARGAAPDLAVMQEGLGWFWDAFRYDRLDGYSIPQGEEEDVDDYRRRCREAILLPDHCRPEEGGLHLTYVTAGLQGSVTIPWAVLGAVDWGAVWDGTGVEAGVAEVRARRARRALSMVMVAVEQVDEEPEGEEAELYNVYGQHWSACVWYPEPALDGVVAWFAGLSELDLGVDPGPQFVDYSGLRLINVTMGYATKVHLLKMYALYNAKVDFNIGAHVLTGITGPVLMECLPPRYRNLAFPAALDQTAYPYGQILPMDAAVHLPNANTAPYASLRTDHAWPVSLSTGVVDMSMFQTRQAVAAFDAAVRLTYQMGQTLTAVHRGPQIIVMRTVSAAVPGGGTVYHAFTMPFHARAAGLALLAPVVLAPSVGSTLILTGCIGFAPHVAFTNS